MGPTKAIVKDSALYDAKTGKLIKDGLTTHEEFQDYANHHYIALPVVNKACQPWLLDGEPIYCLHGTRYENLKDEVLHLAKCPDCGGMGIRDDEPMVESDCIRCVSCGHEFDARIEMMGLLKKAASGVLALLSCSRTMSTLRASKRLRPCWADPSERLRACFFEHSLSLMSSAILTHLWPMNLQYSTDP